MDEALARSALFSELPAATAEELAAQVEQVPMARGDVVFRAGDRAGHLFVVLAGKVKLVQSAPDGRESMAELMGPSDQFGELALFDEGPRTVTAVAVADGRLVRVAGPMARQWASRPELAERLLASVARRLRRSTERISELTAADVPGRLARQLLDLGARFGVARDDGTVHVTHDLTQEELAHLVGATRETVNKTLSEFGQRGWILAEGKAVLLLRPDLLARRVESGCGSPPGSASSQGVGRPRPPVHPVRPTAARDQPPPWAALTRRRVPANGLRSS